MRDGPTVYNIPAGAAFVDALARGLLARYGTDPLRLRAFSLAVDDPDRLRRVLEEAGVDYRSVGGRIIVPAKDALGTAIAFEPV